MWTAKFRVIHKTCTVAPLCKKYHVDDYIYLLNAWSQDNYFYYSETHNLQGSEQNKIKFIKELKKGKTMVKFEEKGSQLFTLNKVEGWKIIFMPLWDKKIIQTKPILQKSDGTEIWELSSWEKKPLTHILERLPEEFEVHLLKMEKLKTTDIFIPMILPNLTKKQKRVIDLALEKGYFTYPRKCSLEDLSKLLELSKQTTRQHLRVAENKLIHYMHKNIIS